MQKNKASKQQRKAHQARLNQTLAASRRAGEARKREQSQLQEQAASRSLHPLGADRREHAIGLFEKYDGMAGMRNAMRYIAEVRNEWAGLPMLLEDQDLVIERTHPYAEKLMELGARASAARAAAVAAEEDELNGLLPVPKAQIRNIFWSWHRRCKVAIFEKGGKIEWGPLGYGNSMDLQIMTLGASDAWGIEQESNAVHLLGSLVRHRQFKQYMLTGMFLEKSKRSGVHYLFRRLRPTLALVADKDRGTMRGLCALCLHPIGFYDQSWAGAMCPTDEVIAHLMLMRGDEHLYWRRANQHPMYVKEAGV